MSIIVNAYCTLRNPPAPQFPHTLNSRRGRDDPALAPHLQDFVNYVVNLGDGQMTAAKYHMMRHIQRVQHQLSLNIDLDDFEEYGRWARSANAITFLPDGSIRDWLGAMLLDAEGQTDPDAQVPYPEDALARKARNYEQLTALGVRVPEHLPPVIGEMEVDLRPAANTARRAMALFVAALRAEVVATRQGPSVVEMSERFPLAFAALSPAEAGFMAAETPDEKQVLAFGWRYEALLVLQWALGLTPELPHPAGICDVPAVASRMLEADAERLSAEAALRPVSEILDALDLHYRMHWAIRQTRLDNKPAPAGLAPGVILERHYALNWLVRFEDAEWDKVSTPT